MSTSAPFIDVQGLSKHFDVSASFLNRLIEGKPKQNLIAVNGVSFQIEQGTTLALVGESGCGKSTIAKLLVGLYEPTQGSVKLQGVDVHACYRSPRALQLRRRVQMIFQDPYASLNPRWHVQDIVAEPLLEHGLMSNATDIEQRVGELLSKVGLNPIDRIKYPHQPTSALDVSVQAQVLNIMQDLQTQHDLTYLFISHNLAVVRHVSDRVGVMYLGRLVELAPTDQLFLNPQHPYTRMLLEAIPKLRDTGRARTPVQGEVPNPLNPPSGCTFHPRCPQATDRCKQERPALRTMGRIQIACHAVT